MLLEINSCEICDNKHLYSFVNLGNHPLCDDLIPLGDSRICEEYPIEIIFCNKCITAHQRFQVCKNNLFPKNYHYRSKNTIDVLNGMQQIVDYCERNLFDLKDKKVLDVGCNDGSLLTFFLKKNAKTFGIEPTNAYQEACKSGHEVINGYFSKKIAISFVKKYGKPDLITFTNVFAHIENLKEIIHALKFLIHKDTIIIIENHYLGSILDKFQFDTFYHEHPRTYSFTSFAYIANLLQLNIKDVSFPSRYNGNIRVIYTAGDYEKSPSRFLDIYKKEQLFSQRLEAMGKKISPWCKKKRNYLEKLVDKHGKLSAKAFPGRAAILIKLLGLNDDLIKATYERSQSNKINHYIPGTRIPILSDNQFDYLNNQIPLLNFAWHIPNEINAYLKERGYHGRVIDIISAKDLA
jgi:hypothetical protein